MNRTEEYEALRQALEPVPAELAYTVQRAETRVKKQRRMRRGFGISAASLAGCFTAFVLLVNCLPTFAYACGRVPLLRELAKAVAFSPSLSAAVGNEYVQPIGQKQTVNGITARVEYVIVDQKQVNIFYVLDTDLYDGLASHTNFTNSDGTPLSGCSIISGDWGIENGELRSVTLDFVDEDVPNAVELTLQVYSTEPDGVEEAVVFTDENRIDEPDDEEPKYVAEFFFSLEFDPYYTAQGEQLQVNQTFALDGQSITLTDAEIYPSHLRLNFSFAPENTAWLSDLKFYLENEQGEVYHPVGNGISATGSVDPEIPVMVSYRADSDFFAHSQRLMLHITQAKWLDKDHQRIWVDLTRGTTEPLPQGVTFGSAEQMENGWELRFFGKKYEENVTYQLFNMEYFDAGGQRHEINSWGIETSGENWDAETQTYREIPGVFTLRLPLLDYTGNEVWLSPCFTRIVDFETPIVIPVK